jgi:hypothetical protein
MIFFDFTSVPNKNLRYAGPKFGSQTKLGAYLGLHTKDVGKVLKAVGLKEGYEPTPLAHMKNLPSKRKLNNPNSKSNGTFDVWFWHMEGTLAFLEEQGIKIYWKDKERFIQSKELFVEFWHKDRTMNWLITHNISSNVNNLKHRLGILQIIWPDDNQFFLKNFTKLIKGKAKELWKDDVAWIMLQTSKITDWFYDSEPTPDIFTERYPDFFIKNRQRFLDDMVEWAHEKIEKGQVC